MEELLLLKAKNALLEAATVFRAKQIGLLKMEYYQEAITVQLKADALDTAIITLDALIAEYSTI